jgi:type IV secretory pathway TraG/TraD family ATPase VirD4
MFDFLSLFSSQKRSLTPRPAGEWPLTMPFLQLTPDPADVWRLQDAVAGTLILGELRSGKTSGSGSRTAKAFLENGMGGLVLCFKTDEADLWRKYLRAANREDDAIFFSTANPHRFNFLEYETSKSGEEFVENVVNLLIDVGSIQRRSASMESDAASFFLGEKKKLLRNAISLLQLSDEPLRLKTIYKMMTSSPSSRDQAKAREWQDGSLLFELLKRGDHLRKNAVELESITDYWLRERPALDPKTRSNVDTDFTGFFDPMVRGKMGELFCTTTNVTPDAIFDGKIIIVDLPVQQYREIGQFAALIWKQLFQRATDRRRKDEGDSMRPVFSWIDEAHHFVIEQDSIFQTTCAANRVCTVLLTQNMPNLYAAFGRDGKHRVDSLTGNLTTKFFHRNSDATTNEWASKMIAKETTYKQSISTTGSVNTPVGANSQISVNEIEEDSCPPKEFLGLKAGGPLNQHIVEGILFQSGRLWQKDLRWAFVRFKQA